MGRKTAVMRLAEVIGYPERMPAGSLSATLRVDGKELLAEESAGRVVLKCPLTEDESLLATLAQYAAGRLLREDATLAFGTIAGGASSGGPAARPSAFLWQDAPSSSDRHTLMRLFETFADSCDWWRERVGALSGVEMTADGGDNMMMIRP